MSPLKSSIWPDAPELAIPDLPTLLCDSDTLWLCYATAHDRRYAIIKFLDLIDHRLAPINDEGLDQHPYARAGLKHYEFNELTGTPETIKWVVLKARHWVITFKDNTLDVVAEGAQVVATGLSADNATAALLAYLQNQSPSC